MFESAGIQAAPWFADMVHNNNTAPLVGVTIVLYALALVLIGIGFKSSPVAWGLVVSGFGTGILGFLVMTAAISRTGLEGQNVVTQQGPALLPWAIAIVAGGLAAHGLRTAWQLFISGEIPKRLIGGGVGLASVFAIVFAVQVVRGGTTIPSVRAGSIAAEASASGSAAASATDDEVPHRCTTCRRFR